MVATGRKTSPFPLESVTKSCRYVPVSSTAYSSVPGATIESKTMEKYPEESVLELAYTVPLEK